MKKIASFIVSSFMCFNFTVPAMADIPETQIVAAISAGMIIPASCTEDLKNSILPANAPATTAKQSPAAVVKQSIPAKPATKVSRSDSGDARMIIQEAQSLLGKKYVYGSAGPNAFDCSGLVMYVFNKAGISLPHNAAEQAGYGVHVDKSDLQPGDVVFFSYYGGKGINHSGIYIGDGNFIHASTSSGVITTGLSSDYYSNNYKGARRIIR